MSNPLQAVCEDHYVWLCQWWRRRLDHADEAADLAHDTFLRVLRKPEEISCLRQPRAYLTPIARGLLNDHWRRRSLERAWLEALAQLPPRVRDRPRHALADAAGPATPRRYAGRAGPTRP
ncbi:sigma factor [Bordetella avium]|uniref:sigma factor n=1 Tax=Bordetella avium TaxID=521 RepID=UPI00300C4754